MFSDSRDFKHKYKELSREFRALEKQQQKDVQLTEKRTALLEQVIRQLTLELHGFDSAVDHRLDGILSALEQPGVNALKRAAAQLEKAVKKTQSRRQKTAEEILLAVRRWISELRALSEQEMTLNALEVMRNRAPESVHNYYDLPSLLSNMVRLQGEIMDNLSGTLPGSGAQPPQQDEDTQLLLRHIASDLLELIDGLQLSSKHRWEAEQLLGQLENGFALNELPSLMQRTVKLVSLCNRSLSEDFEHFLLDMGQKLAQMQDFMYRSYREQQQAGQSQLQVNRQVATEVESIKAASAQAVELRDLKQLVSAQLGQVQGSINRLREQEEQRQQEANERHEALSEKLRSVEAEAQQTMARVEEERLRSRLDPLTQLPNRTAYTERLTQELARSRRSQNPLALAVCDIDHFKRVNDTFGHLAGDKALRLVAKVLTDALRKSDFIARYGGEEFVIIMSNTPCHEAARVLDKIREAVASSPFNFKGDPVPITLSLGVTELLPDDSLSSLFDRADALLYRAKNEGRNRLVSDMELAEASEEN